MSDVLSGISKVAGFVASIAVFIPGGQAIAAIAAGVAGVTGVVAQLTAEPPRRPGIENSFRIDPQAGIPYIVGRTAFGGRVVHRRGYGGDKNPYYTYIGVLSGGGPIDAVEAWQANSTTISFSGGNAVGYYHNFMYLSTQVGATPEGAALAPPFGGFPDWGASHKLSGYAAYCWTLKFDPDGKVYGSGEPEPRAIVRGVKVYDPRLDSTFPGGSGACRALVESTYVYSTNGPLHGLTWLLGRWQNGKRALGCGVPPTEIDIAAFVDAANTADANGWDAGAVFDGSGDKWNNLKLMLQSAAAEPMDLGGYIGCHHERLRVSLATIGPDDLAAGRVVLPAMRTFRDRINGIIPRYRSEDNNWEIVPGATVRSSTYLAEDGEERTREQEYHAVQDVTHASQLAAYDIAKGREAEGITLPLKLKWIGYRPGDCLTIHLPEDEIYNLKVIVLRRTIDPKSGIVTMIFRTETDGKHPWALGLTGTAPPSATVISGETSDAVVSASAIEAGAQASIRLARFSNLDNPGVSVLNADSTGTITVDQSLWDYPVPVADATRAAGSITGLTVGTEYHAYFDDATLAATSPTYAVTTDWQAAQSATTAYPYRHFLGSATIPATGSSVGSGGGFGGGGPEQ